MAGTRFSIRFELAREHRHERHGRRGDDRRSAPAGHEEPDLADDVAGSQSGDDVAVPAHFCLAGLDHEELVRVLALGRERRARLHRHLAGAGSDLRALLVEVGDEEGYYEVEVTRADGGQVEVHLDGDFRVLGSVGDDDGAEEGDGQGDD